ncbi:SDR family oxidoreductase [Desulforhopalus sp. 52FAK]
MERLLVAGATGYLGRHIVEHLVAQHFKPNVLVRNTAKFESFGLPVNKLIQGEVTDSASLRNCCDGIDVVISSVGITRQSDGLTYMDVDYQANVNLLNEARKSGVKKFIYVSVLNGEKLTALNICAAKEKFVEELKQSGLEYCIIRPNGFFSDMSEFYNMAQRGRIYLFGDGSLKSNPIHGGDLAQVCIDAVALDETEIEVGGPQTLRQVEIAELAFEAVGKPVKISYIPDWGRRLALKLLKLILSKQKYGPVEFFMSVMALEMKAPEYGEQTLKDYFISLKNKASL